MRVAMSHAHLVWQMDDESLLSIVNLSYKMHTANAVTVSERSSRICQQGSLYPILLGETDREERVKRPSHTDGRFRATCLSMAHLQCDIRVWPGPL